jgi:hypothetical protein
MESLYKILQNSHRIIFFIFIHVFQDPDRGPMWQMIEEAEEEMLEAQRQSDAHAFERRVAERLRHFRYNVSQHIPDKIHHITYTSQRDNLYSQQPKFKHITSTSHRDKL